jgi:hypothetical protein
MDGSGKVIVGNGTISGISGLPKNSFVDKCYSLWRTLCEISNFLIFQPNYFILKKIIFSLALIVSSTAFTATSDELAMLLDTDKVTKVTVAENNWIILENNPINGMTRLRDFHDMGALGLQQIDYVVNCANKRLALAGFAEVPTEDAKYHILNNQNYTELSFYRPVIQHDKNIIDFACLLH